MNSLPWQTDCVEGAPQTLFDRLAPPCTIAPKKDAPESYKGPLHVKDKGHTILFTETRKGWPVVLTRDEVNEYYEEFKR